MTIFGLTGSIACGKSTVSKILNTAGATMIDADAIARSLVELGQPLLQEIARHFSDILQEDGALNRHKLGALVFGDPDQKRLLDSIMSQPIQAAVDAAIQEAKKTSNLIGYDCALIIETNQQKRYRPLVVVAVSPEVQLQRLMDRNHLTKEQAKQRIDSQMSTADKLKFADYVIWNNFDMSDLTAETIHVFNSLVKEFSIS